MRPTTSLSPAHARYLRLLGETAAAPDAAFLARLVRAQLLCCPFENLSKLRRVRRRGLRTLPSLDEFLDGIEHERLGGTCYANNGHFFSLLRALGFDCDLLGADMDAPDVHAVVGVRLDGRQLLVDVGYAAPFYAPLALDAPDAQELRFGNDGYRLWPRDAQGRTALDHLRDGARVHGYVVNPTPRALAHFDGVVRDSLADTAHFMRVLRFERFSERGSVSLLDRRLRVVDGPRCTFRELDGPAGVREALERDLGVPRAVAAEALACLDWESPRS